MPNGQWNGYPEPEIGDLVQVLATPCRGVVEGFDTRRGELRLLVGLVQSDQVVIAPALMVTLIRRAGSNKGKVRA